MVCVWCVEGARGRWVISVCLKITIHSARPPFSAHLNSRFGRPDAPRSSLQTPGRPPPFPSNVRTPPRPSLQTYRGVWSAPVANTLLRHVASSPPAGRPPGAAASSGRALRTVCVSSEISERSVASGSCLRARRGCAVSARRRQRRWAGGSDGRRAGPCGAWAMRALGKGDKSGEVVVALKLLGTRGAARVGLEAEEVWVERRVERLLRLREGRGMSD